MAELGDLLREAVGDGAPGNWSVDDIGRRAHRRRRRRRLGGVVVALVVTAATAAGVLSAMGGPPEVDVVGRPDVDNGQPVFSTPSGVALLFDDGYDGVTALDLDTGIVGRRAVDGQRAGDQPNRLFRSGDSLIVGRGEVFAAPLDGGPSVSLGQATIAQPAVEPGRVWLSTWSGGSIGAGELTLRRVDLHGRVEKTVSAPAPDLLPTAILGGIAYNTPDGSVLYAGIEGEAGFGFSDARVLTASPDLTVFCRGHCDSFTVTRPRGTPAREVPLPGGLSLADAQPMDLALSPDGSMLAFVAAAPTSRLAVVDLETGRLITDRPVDPVSSVVWSPDGHQLFWSTYSYGAESTAVGRVDVASGSVESRRLTFGGVIRSVAVARAEAVSFLPPEPTDPGSCPPPTIQPSNRTGTCGFRVTGRADVTAPVVLGRDVTQAEDLLSGLGLTLSVAAGDPRTISAIVVSQDPAGGTTLPRGTAVAVRTTVLDPQLCVVLAGAAATDDVLRQARPVAPSGMVADIDVVLGADEHLRGGFDAPHVVARREALDRIDIAIQACGRS